MKIVINCLLLPLFCLGLFPFSILASESQTDHHQDILHCLVSSSPSISEVTYTPTNTSYTSILEFSMVNQRFAKPETPKPLLIVTPKEESQIRTVIHCSKMHDIQMRIRGGGNDFEGLSYISHVPFVLLDMINLRSIDVDPVAATATVQSGATAGELYYAISQKTKTLGFTGPTFSSVGIAGLDMEGTNMFAEGGLNTNSTVLSKFVL